MHSTLPAKKTKRTGRPDDELPTIDRATGTLKFFSVSSLKTFKLCPRQWWFDKHEGLPTKQTKGAKLGHEAHERVEWWELTGQDVRGKVERKGEHLLKPYEPYLPFNRPNLQAIEVEANLFPRLVTPGGVVMRGFTDLLVEPQFAPARDGLPEFVDHKFLRDFKYAPDEAALLEDTQGLGYAAWGLLVRWPGAERVRFTHHQHARESAEEPRRVSTVYDLTTVKRAWEDMRSIVDGPMAAAARATTQEEVPTGDLVGDEEAGRQSCCDSYGRCSFRSKCNASPENRIALQFLTQSEPKKAEPNMGLLDQMGAAPALAPQQPATPPAPAPVTPPAHPTVVGVLHASMAAQGALYTLPDGRVGAFNGMAGPFAIFTLGDGAPATVPGNTIVSPFQTAAAPAPAAPTPAPVQVPPPAPIVAPVPAAAPTAGPVTGVLPPDAPTSNPGALTPAPAAQASAPAAEPEKKPRTRRANAKGAEQAEGGEALTERDDLVLLVDVAVSRGIARNLAPIIATEAEKLAKAANTIDVRCADKSSPLAYSGWKGALGAAVEAVIEPGIYAVSSGELADVVIERLSGKALVIRGR